MGKAIDIKKEIIGVKHGRWMPLKQAEYRIKIISGKPFNERMIECLCDCGTIKIVSMETLRRGTSRSCGCLTKESARARLIKLKTTHGFTYEKLYHKWEQIRARCNSCKSSSYKDYGGRGIKLEPYFDNYVNFRNYVMALPNFDKIEELKLSLDRIDNNKGYERGNLRWADVYTQRRNKRDNYLVAYKGETKCLIEWSLLYNIKYGTLRRRIKQGWDIDSAINKPVRKFKNEQKNQPTNKIHRV